VADPPARPLTIELLVQLDLKLEAIGAPVAALWRPGLNDRQVDALTAEIGISLSTEARTWWAWHDGVDLDAAPPSSLGLGRGWAPYPLAVAVEDVKLKRQLSVAAANENAGFHNSDWPDSWVTLCGDVSYPRIVCDCAVPDGTPSTVHYFDPAGNMEPARPHLPSIGELVHIWLEALEDGTWRIDPATGSFALLDPTELMKAKGRDIADLL
jgi:hypothetical protein